MFCSSCGARNREDATHCVICGTALLSPTTSEPPAPPSAVPTVAESNQPAAVDTAVTSYLAWAILTTLFCCLPTGVVAIVHAAQVSSKLAANDIAGARRASAHARTWSWVSFGLGLAVILVWIVLVAVSAAAGA
jgi:predicted nucleic acid-binding Zn ribbon protein